MEVTWRYQLIEVYIFDAILNGWLNKMIRHFQGKNTALAQKNTTPCMYCVLNIRFCGKSTLRRPPPLIRMRWTRKVFDNFYSCSWKYIHSLTHARAHTHFVYCNQWNCFLLDLFGQISWPMKQKYIYSFFNKFWS